MVELPKVEYETPSKFFLSLSVYFLTLLLVSSSLSVIFITTEQLPQSLQLPLFFLNLTIGIAFIFSLCKGLKLFQDEEEFKKIRHVIERDILLWKYWEQAIEYNQKARDYNKEHKTPIFKEKEPLEYPSILREALNPNFLEKLKEGNKDILGLDKPSRVWRKLSFLKKFSS